MFNPELCGSNLYYLLRPRPSLTSRLASAAVPLAQIMSELRVPGTEGLVTWLTQVGYRDVEGGAFTERVVEIPRFLERVLALSPTTPILDVGCAGSFMPLFYISLGFEVHGLDLRDPGFRREGFTFLEGDAADVELPQRYDLIAMLSTLEHCGFDAYGDEPSGTDEEVVSNLRRYLTDRGRFLCSVPFGRPAKLEWFRVYNWDGLCQLFGAVENPFFYASREGMWYPASREQAEALETDQWPPRAVIVFECPAA